MQPINRTKFSGEKFDNIVNSLKSTFGNIYPDYEIEITYQKESRDSPWTFSVYLKGETFGIHDDIPMLKDHLVFVDSFRNSDAILFSDYSRKEFENEFDEYKPENMDIIRDAIEKMKEEFKDKGEFLTADVDSSRYNVKFKAYVPGNKFLRDNRFVVYGEIYHYFNVVPISVKSAKAAVSKIRGTIKNCILRTERACLKEYPRG